MGSSVTRVYFGEVGEVPTMYMASLASMKALCSSNINTATSSSKTKVHTTCRKVNQYHKHPCMMDAPRIFPPPNALTSRRKETSSTNQRMASTMNNFNIMTKEPLHAVRVERPDQELYCQLSQQIKPKKHL